MWEVRMRRAHELAVEVASFVCSCQGAMNRIPAAIVEKSFDCLLFRFFEGDEGDFRAHAYAGRKEMVAYPTGHIQLPAVFPVGAGPNICLGIGWDSTGNFR